MDGYKICIYKNGIKSVQKKIKSKGFIPNVPQFLFSEVPFTQNVRKGKIKGSDKELNFTVNDNTLTITEWNNSAFIKVETPKDDFESNFRKLIAEQKRKTRKKRLTFFFILLLLIFVTIMLYSNYGNYRDIVFTFIKGILGGRV
jgi:hypothetical protein